MDSLASPRPALPWPTGSPCRLVSLPPPSDVGPSVIWVLCISVTPGTSGGLEGEDRGACPWEEGAPGSQFQWPWPPGSGVRLFSHPRLTLVPGGHIGEAYFLCSLRSGALFVHSQCFHQRRSGGILQFISQTLRHRLPGAGPVLGVDAESPHDGPRKPRRSLTPPYRGSVNLLSLAKEGAGSPDQAAALSRPSGPCCPSPSLPWP